MDGSRQDRPVKQASRQNQLQRAPPKNKFLKVHSAPVELTPLSRLARFKEIRDRNLAKASSANGSKRPSVAHQSSSKMLNVDSGTNGVAHSTNGDAESHGVPRSPSRPKSLKNPKASNRVEPSERSEPSSETAAPSARNGVGTLEESVPQNGVVVTSQVQPQQEESGDVVTLEEEQVETEAGSGSEAETEGNGQESEGSSLEVVIDESSSGESLDLNISTEEFQTPSRSGVDVPIVVPGPSGSACDPERETTPNVEEPYVPDVIKRLRSGGHISSRPTLRGKRRQEDDIYSGGRKRHCDDSSSVAGYLSASWQFLSPSSALKRVWNRQAEPAGPRHADDSMIVNVSAADPPNSQKWCRIM